MGDYSREEVAANSEFAEAILNTFVDLPRSKNGLFSSDQFASLGPVVIPCRRIKAGDVIRQFDKPSDLAIVDDDTPNGKKFNLHSVVHKKHEKWIRRRHEITKEVFREHGIEIGDPANDKFVSFADMAAWREEVSRRHNEEIARNN